MTRLLHDQNGTFEDRQRILASFAGRAEVPYELRLLAIDSISESDLNPWSSEVIGAVVAILRDPAIALEERVRIADKAFAYREVTQVTRELLDELARGPNPPEWALLRTAGRLAGAELIRRLASLAGSSDNGIAEKAHAWLSGLAGDPREDAHVRTAALRASIGKLVEVKHVFVSYVRDDSAEVMSLVAALRSQGVPMWIDVEQLPLRPGRRWKPNIRDAIRKGNAFLAVFSTDSEARPRSTMREELLIAVEELRLRPQDRAWFFPVLLTPCELPAITIGPGETLRDLQWVSLYDGDNDSSLKALADALNATLLD